MQRPYATYMHHFTIKALRAVLSVCASHNTSYTYLLYAHLVSVSLSVTTISSPRALVVCSLCLWRQRGPLSPIFPIAYCQVPAAVHPYLL